MNMKHPFSSILPKNKNHNHNLNQNQPKPPSNSTTVADVLLTPTPPYPSAGSKDENFFDSQPWFESDCEDDYYSVKGDFTPSCGTTPVHYNFSLGNRAPSVEGNPSPPESDKRKRLSELFKDSFHDNTVGEAAAAPNRNEAPAKVVPEPATPLHRPSKSTNGTPYLSLSRVLSSHSAGKGPKRVPKAEDNSQCCLPRLLLRYRLKETKQVVMSSPARNAG